MKHRSFVERKSSSKKIILCLGVLFIVLVFNIVAVLAYFSDVNSHRFDIVAGSLRLSGEYSVSINGANITDTTEISICPGDIIVLKAEIANIGNKSAWIREIVDVSFSTTAMDDYVELYTGNIARENIATSSESLLVLEEGSFTSVNRVIDGGGDNPEIIRDHPYQAIGADHYSFEYTVYFLPEAPNQTQEQQLDFSVSVQALQFSNNNENEPTELAWSAVVPAVLK